MKGFEKNSMNELLVIQEKLQRAGTEMSLIYREVIIGAMTLSKALSEKRGTDK